MTRVLVWTKLTSDQAGRSVKLEYYLLEEKEGEWEQYGIEVVMYRERSEERCAVRHITPMVQRAVELVERLAEGKVTPATLPEILEDIL